MVELYIHKIAATVQKVETWKDITQYAGRDRLKVNLFGCRRTNNGLSTFEIINYFDSL